MVDLRTLGEEDIDFALQLSYAEGWDYTRGDFLRLISYDPEGCFIASIGGTDCGMVTTTPYGGTTGFIGCLLVDPPFRGKKVGMRLFGNAIDHLRSKGIDSIFLEALPRAVGLYERAGFVSLWQSLRLLGLEFRTTPRPIHVGRGKGRHPDASRLEVRPYRPSDLQGITELDVLFTRMERTEVLKDLLTNFSDTTFVCEVDGEISGFLSARPATRGYRLGPWICAPDGDEIPRALLEHASRFFEGQKLFVGIPAVNTIGVNLFKRHGFKDGLTCNRMRWGKAGYDGDPESIFGITSAEKG